MDNDELCREIHALKKSMDDITTEMGSLKNVLNILNDEHLKDNIRALNDLFATGIFSEGDAQKLLKKINEIIEIMKKQSKTN